MDAKLARIRLIEMDLNQTKLGKKLHIPRNRVNDALAGRREGRKYQSRIANFLGLPKDRARRASDDESPYIAHWRISQTVSHARPMKTTTLMISIFINCSKNRTALRGLGPWLLTLLLWSVGAGDRFNKYFNKWKIDFASGGFMDKTGNANYIRLPLRLQDLIEKRARKEGRSKNEMIKHLIARGLHFSSFDVEDYTNLFFDSEGKNCQEVWQKL